VAVEERELLLAMGGVVRRIEIDRDAAGAAAQPGAVLPDDEVRQRMPQPRQRPRADRILDARQRRLGRQGRAGQRIAIEQELEDGVVGQPGGVVAIGIAADQPEDALPHQVDEVVLDLARLAPLPQTASHRLGDAQLSIDRLEQDHPAVRAACSASNRATTSLSNLNRSWGIQSVAIEPPRECVKASRHRSFRTLRRLDGCLFHPSRIKRARSHDSRRSPEHQRPRSDRNETSAPARACRRTS
jgi:hypothetical protein